eukprot:gene16735-biopygen16871
MVALVNSNTETVRDGSPGASEEGGIVANVVPMSPSSGSRDALVPALRDGWLRSDRFANSTLRASATARSACPLSPPDSGVAVDVMKCLHAKVCPAAHSTEVTPESRLAVTRLTPLRRMYTPLYIAHTRHMACGSSLMP